MRRKSATNDLQEVDREKTVEDSPKKDSSAVFSFSEYIDWKESVFSEMSSLRQYVQSVSEEGL